MNNVLTPGLYVISDANAPAHCPSWGGMNSLVIVYRFSSFEAAYKRYVQIMIEVNTRGFGFRIGSQDGFNDTWHRLAEV